MNPKRIGVLVQKEWREMVRDRGSFLLAWVVPPVLMIVLSYGLSLEVENIPLAVVDDDGSQMSRDHANRFIHSRYFDFKGYVERLEDIDPLLADNRIRVVLVIPAHFQERLLSGRAVSVQVLIDGTSPARAQIIKGYVLAINSGASRDSLAAYLARERGLSPEEARVLVEPLTLEVRYLYNPELRSSRSFAPAMIMGVLTITSPLLTALGVVREKENGSIYHLYTSTITRSEVLVGKLLPYVAVSGVNVIVLWLLATCLFDVPLQGNFGVFYLASLVYVVCATGIGLLVSLWVGTQIAALLITMVLTIVPTILYSGMLISVSALSPTGQAQAHMFPALYFNNMVQGSFLKGVGLSALWVDVLVLMLYSAVLFGVGYRLFTKRSRV